MLLSVTGCSAFGPPADAVDFLEADENPQQYRGQTIKLCGWVERSVNRHGPSLRSRNPRKPTDDASDQSFGLVLMRGQPTVGASRFRCVTGELEPSDACGGWIAHDRRAVEFEELKRTGTEEEIHTAIGCRGLPGIHFWQIRQTELGRK